MSKTCQNSIEIIKNLKKDDVNMAEITLERTAFDDLVNGLAQCTQKLREGDSLWAIAEPECRARIAPRFLALNAQLKPEDKLEMNIKADRLTINGRELPTPVGVVYEAFLIRPNEGPRSIYRCCIDLIGIAHETGSELLY